LGHGDTDRQTWMRTSDLDAVASTPVYSGHGETKDRPASHRATRKDRQLERQAGRQTDLFAARSAIDGAPSSSSGGGGPSRRDACNVESQHPVTQCCTESTAPSYVESPTRSSETVAFWTKNLWKRQAGRQTGGRPDRHEAELGSLHCQPQSLAPSVLWGLVQIHSRTSCRRLDAGRRFPSAIGISPTQRQPAFQRTRMVCGPLGPCNPKLKADPTLPATSGPRQGWTPPSAISQLPHA
jgi:hypothetical protein